MIDLSGRHPSQHVMRYFTSDHLPLGPLRKVSQTCAALAEVMVEQLPDGPELTTGLRDLLRAKDCFVRAALDVDVRAT